MIVFSITLLSLQFENEVGDSAGRYCPAKVEIDELLNSGDSSLMRQLRVSKAAEQRRKSEAPSEDYEQEFDEYEETRKLETVSYRSDFHAESNPEWKKTKTVLPAGKENQIQESIAAVEESIPKTGNAILTKSSRKAG